MAELTYTKVGDYLLPNLIMDGEDEAMKARDQMGWVQAVNSFKAQAEEVVLVEIVYR